ncbi:MAG TPA: IS91 family transposase [Polyangia bacterium]
MASQPCSAETGQARPRLEVADIFRAASGAYCDRYVPTPEQRKVIVAIERCRTAKLGGHVDVCSKCGHERPSYNSCRNRHCPKCQCLAQARWIARRQERVIPTKYFHVVFTLPEPLRTIARANPVAIYDLLFESATRTLLDFGHSRLHAQIGITAVLHTWTRDLRFHPHVHCIVTAGGLDDDGHWVPARSRFLFPVKAMSKVFRGKFLEGLTMLHANQSLAYEGHCSHLGEPSEFAKLKDRLYDQSWVVYAKQAFGGPAQVFQYLGRYTHRVGISNQRLVSFDGAEVCFFTKQGKTSTIDAVEFVRRFLLHVLPAHFVKIRHYGLVAAANVRSKLETARCCLQGAAGAAQPTPRPASQPSWQELLCALTGFDLHLCPACGARAMQNHSIAPGMTNGWQLDTS